MAGIVSPEYAGTAMLAVTSAVGSFSTFLPPITDVRHMNQYDDSAGDVRLGEVAAAMMTVGIGVVASSVVGNGVPFAVSILAASLLVCLYEWALQGKPFAGSPTNAAPLRAVPTER